MACSRSSEHLSKPYSYVIVRCTRELAQRCFLVAFSLKDSMWAKGHNTHSLFLQEVFPLCWIVAGPLGSLKHRSQSETVVKVPEPTRSTLLFLAGPVWRFTLNYTWDHVYAIDSSIYNSLCGLHIVQIEFHSCVSTHCISLFLVCSLAEWKGGWCFSCLVRAMNRRTTVVLNWIDFLANILFISLSFLWVCRKRMKCMKKWFVQLKSWRFSLQGPACSTLWQVSPVTEFHQGKSAALLAPSFYVLKVMDKVHWYLTNTFTCQWLHRCLGLKIRHSNFVTIYCKRYFMCAYGFALKPINVTWDF